MPTVITDLAYELLQHIAKFVLSGTSSKKRKDEGAYRRNFELPLRYVHSQFEQAFTPVLFERCSIGFDDKALLGLQSKHDGTLKGTTFLWLLKQRPDIATAVRYLVVRVTHRGLSSPARGAERSAFATAWQASARLCEVQLAKELAWLFQACSGLLSLDINISGAGFFRDGTDLPLALAFPSTLQDLVLDGGAFCLLFPYLRAHPYSGPARHLRSLTLAQTCIGTLHSVLRRQSETASGFQVVSGSRPSLAVDKLETNMRLEDLAEILESVRIHARTLHFCFDGRMLVDMTSVVACFKENIQCFGKAQVQELEIVFDTRAIRQPAALIRNKIDHYGARMSWERESALSTLPMTVSLINKRGVLIKVAQS